MLEHPINEPITFVVEARAGRETPSVVYGLLPTRLTMKGSKLLVYAYRMDKMPNGAEAAKKPIDELYQNFVVQRKSGTLPQSNLADPPQKSDGGRKGSLRGEENWWKPPLSPRGSDWTPD